MGINITFLYRGPIKSCNYDCWYCPFAKTTSTETVLEQDRDALKQFINKIEGLNEYNISIFFTPCGEALIYPWYRDAIHQLSHFAHIDKVVIQTNLSSELNWLEHVNNLKVALWCTYHPQGVDQNEFIRKTEVLSDYNISHSVGIVGLKEFIGEAEVMRFRLPLDIYLWINAYKRREYYSENDISRLTRIDPYFQYNNTTYHSLGASCECGHSVFAVDGSGNIKCCHFVNDCLGNLYTTNIDSLFKGRTCPQNECKCYIGYIHINHLKLKKIYGNRILERIPNTIPNS